MRVPTYKEAMQAVKRDNATELDWFVYNWLPDDREQDFLTDLSGVLYEAAKDTQTRQPAQQ